MLKHWWERWPGRLDHELDALKKAEIPYSRDFSEFARGRLVLHLRLPIEGKPRAFVARFPDLYPYTRFEVTAPDLSLTHHQNPINKNLCLIGRATDNWSLDDTLAAFIQERLPQVIHAGTSTDAHAVAEIEEHQAEPLSDYFQYQSGACLLIDSAWKLGKDSDEGELVIGTRGPAQRLLRGAVLQVLNEGGEPIAHADEAIKRLYSNTLFGYWFRCSTAPLASTANDALSTIRQEGHHTEKAPWQQTSDGLVKIVGVTFPEELSTWRKSGEGWLFIVRLLQRGPYAPRGFRSREKSYFARAARAGRSDVAARTPELSPLPTKRVAVVGLGCVGAPSVLQLARAGIGEIRILDHDFVEPGTISRWPLGLDAAGLPKTEALKAFIRLHYPYTKVEAFTHLIGGAFDQQLSDLKVLDEMLENIDLLYDATAETGIQHVLSGLAAERKIPYIAVSTTPGAWGGRVARIRPGKTDGCWLCLQWAEETGAILRPPGDPKEPVQPAGCAAPMFTGSGFDVMEVVVTGVRLAVATLCEGTDGGYPDFNWDVGVLSLRDSAGRPIQPEWKTFALKQHPSCENCKPK